MSEQPWENQLEDYLVSEAGVEPECTFKGNRHQPPEYNYPEWFENAAQEIKWAFDTAVETIAHAVERNKITLNLDQDDTLFDILSQAVTKRLTDGRTTKGITVTPGAVAAKVA